MKKKYTVVISIILIGCVVVFIQNAMNKFKMHKYLLIDRIEAGGSCDLQPVKHNVWLLIRSDDFGGEIDDSQITITIKLEGKKSDVELKSTGISQCNWLQNDNESYVISWDELGIKINNFNYEKLSIKEVSGLSGSWELWLITNDAK